MPRRIALPSSSLVWLTILAFSGGRERERSDRRVPSDCNAGLAGTLRLGGLVEPSAVRTELAQSESIELVTMTAPVCSERCKGIVDGTDVRGLVRANNLTGLPHDGRLDPGSAKVFGLDVRHRLVP